MLIIIRYCCGKHCELLLNRFLIKDLPHILNLLRHLPLSSIIDDKIRPPPTSFSTPCGKKMSTPTSSLYPPPTKISTPHLHFDNSITDYYYYKTFLIDTVNVTFCCTNRTRSITYICYFLSHSCSAYLEQIPARYCDKYLTHLMNSRKPHLFPSFHSAFTLN